MSKVFTICAQNVPHYNQHCIKLAPCNYTPLFSSHVSPVICLYEIITQLLTSSAARFFIIWQLAQTLWYNINNVSCRQNVSPASLETPLKIKMDSPLFQDNHGSNHSLTGITVPHERTNESAIPKLLIVELAFSYCVMQLLGYPIL